MLKSVRTTGVDVEDSNFGSAGDIPNDVLAIPYHAREGSQPSADDQEPLVYLGGAERAGRRRES